MLRLINSGDDSSASYIAAPDMPHPAKAPHLPQNSAESHHDEVLGASADDDSAADFDEVVDAPTSISVANLLV